MTFDEYLGNSIAAQVAADNAKDDAAELCAARKALAAAWGIMKTFAQFEKAPPGVRAALKEKAKALR